MSRPSRPSLLAVAAAALLAVTCGGAGGESAAGRQRGGGAPGGSPWAGAGGGEVAAAVPVEVATVERRDISSFIETHGTLEAENEVDLVGRVSAPIVELRAEEGMAVARGQLLARLDEAELAAQLEISRVNLAEAEQAWERAQQLEKSQLISPEEYEQARTRFETARAQFEGDRIQMGYTEVRAPFAGLVVARYVDLAEQISPGTPMFRLSDFDPLLCPIQVPERDLSRIEIGQSAYLEVEAWPDERFAAEVLRIRPVVDAATGTVRVTLSVAGRGKLRPGMFADVFVETDRREAVLVMPKAALSVDSIGDTVYVAADGIASRREVELGFAEGDFVEAISGLADGEQVVVVGQDGLSDGTPIQVLSADGAAPVEAAAAAGPGAASVGGPVEGRPAGVAGGPPPGFDPADMTPERLEQIKERMRARGLTDEQIEERLRQMRRRQGGS
jgi:membrane fusion protein (multidrug efflux system)